jgi:hypothetical protein
VKSSGQQNKFVVHPTDRQEVVALRRRQLKMYFWINDAERDFIQTESEKTKLSREGFMRARILGEAIPPPEHPDLSKLIRELNAIGNNINQLAVKANVGKPVAKAELLLAKKAFEDMERKVLEVVRFGTNKDLGEKLSNTGSG